MPIPGFFSFTLQGLAIFTAIATVGFKVILLLRKIDRGFDIWQWQHLVMWSKFEKENPIPPYPRLSWEDDATARKNWLGRVVKANSEPPPR